jgi:glycosyltransferase involved in cell wall biosynthesis
MSVDLSVLICSTHTRYLTFGPAIARQVWEQYEALPLDYQARMEILILTDNKQMPLGRKRNIMVGMAQGRYVQFVDDDDRIAPDMFAAVLDGIDSGADVITFLASVTLNGGRARLCRFSKDIARDCRTPREYRRLPNHLCCVRRELALKAPFPLVTCGEDVAYSRQLKRHLRSQHHIERVLYYYDYSDATTETQQRVAARR